jgi:hypothetical protein
MLPRLMTRALNDTHDKCHTRLSIFLTIRKELLDRYEPAISKQRRAERNDKP